MSRANKIQKITRIFLIIGVFVFVVIAVNFGIHVKRLTAYNEQERVITNFSDTTDVLVDIHPRGLATDTWEKTDAFRGRTIYATIYEGTIQNNSKSDLRDWTLRINVNEDIWINNAWSGTVEIHQFTDAGEKVQTLSLQDYDKDKLELNYLIGGQDLLIPLSQGDYFIYYPCTTSGISEEVVESNEYFNGTRNFGFILYGNKKDIDLSSYEFTYRYDKDLWAGKEPKIFRFVLPIWGVSMLVLAIIAVFMSRYERGITKQTIVTNELIESFVNYVDSKGVNKDGHSKNVAVIARKIARKLGMNRDDSNKVYYAALVHDVGKFCVPDYILKKSGELTEEESNQIKQHTVKGAEILNSCKSNSFIRDAALYHHERYDGAGYPTGKSGEEIPLVGRIISAANFYASMKYHDADNIYSKQEIIDELSKEKGKRFDPVIVDTLIDVIQEMDMGN